jgi:hypothetical protein
MPPLRLALVHRRVAGRVQRDALAVQGREEPRGRETRVDRWIVRARAIADIRDQERVSVDETQISRCRDGRGGDGDLPHQLASRRTRDERSHSRTGARNDYRIAHSCELGQVSLGHELITPPWRNDDVETRRGTGAQQRRGRHWSRSDHRIVAEYHRSARRAAALRCIPARRFVLSIRCLRCVHSTGSAATSANYTSAVGCARGSGVELHGLLERRCKRRRAFLRAAFHQLLNCQPA